MNKPISRAGSAPRSPLSTLLVCLAAMAAVATAATACSGWDDATQTVSTKQCEALREHSLTLRLQASGVSKAVLEEHRRQLRDAIGERSVDWCVQSLAPAQLACAMAARTVAALDVCVPPVSAGS